jgi:hemolysin III
MLGGKAAADPSARSAGRLAAPPLRENGEAARPAIQLEIIDIGMNLSSDSMNPNAKQMRRAFTRSEEWANSLIHAVGAVLGIIALVLLVIEATDGGRTGSVEAVVIYGAALILLFASSAIYHGLSDGPAKRLFRSFDHAGIFLLIAGTYTPFCLLLPPERRWILLIVVWVLAGLGIVLQTTAFLANRIRHYERMAFVLYLALGWIPILAVGQEVLAALSQTGLMLLVAGGVAYSIGVIFYLGRRLQFGHAIWHLFVLSASALHFFAVLLFVVPAPA